MSISSPHNSTMALAGRTRFLGLAVVVVLTTFLLKPTNSFAPVSTRQRSTGWGTTTVTQRKIYSSLLARIYGPSGAMEEVDENETINSLFPTSSSSDKNSALVDFLSHDRITALARLAVAFAPPGHALDLRDVEHVQVLRVDQNHIDIQAVVCEQDGCVTLQVPVSFPHPCMDSEADELQECIMGNLGELEVQAETFLRTIDWKESNYEDVQAGQREWQVLLETDDLHFPEWWVHPDTREMRGECQSVRNLLNEEGFLAEIRALTGMALTESDAVISTDDGHADTSDWTVEQAAVAAVGPAGLLIRAATQRLELFQETDTRRIVEVPISFKATANNVSDLRAAVLGSIAAAGDFVEDNV